MPTTCKCESVHHFSRPSLPDSLRDHPNAGSGHRYMAVPAGDQRAWGVGEVCDPCATTHMAIYLLDKEPVS